MIFDKYPFAQGKMFQILDKEGKVINNNEKVPFTNEQLVQAYKLMCLSRKQDEKQTVYQRTGKMSTWLSSTGQEATEVGYSMNIDAKKHDWFVPAYRNQAAWLTLGIPPRNVMMYWSGNEWGAHTPAGINVTPIQICIGTQYSHAAGIAFANKFKKNDGVTFVTIGDGGTGEGEFYEAMNFAATHKLPVVFMVENNQYALTSPKRIATVTKTYAEKALAVGIPGLVVDGNDLLATLTATHQVKEYAKHHGPVLVEYYTYRIGAHGSADDPKAYRNEEYHNEQLKNDPIPKMRKYLEAHGLWNETKQTELDAHNDKYISEEFEWVVNNREYKVEDMFKYTYHEMDTDLKHQMEEAKKVAGK